MAWYDFLYKLLGFNEITDNDLANNDGDENYMITNMDQSITMHKPKDLQIFHPNSVWNKKIEEFEVHPDSAEIMKTVAKYSQGYGVNYKKWTVPVFFIRNGMMVKLHRDDNEPYYDLFQDELVPYVEGIFPDPEADGHCCIVDLDSLKAYDMSRLNIANATASTFNVWDLKGWGLQVPFQGVHWYRQGSRASGCPLLGGLIFKDEIEKGVISHALACSIPNVMLGQKLVLPASRANEKNDTVNTFGLSGDILMPNSEGDVTWVSPSIPYGARIRLKPDFDISGLSATTKIIAKALQDYGAFVVDRAPAFAFYTQNLGADGKEWEELVGDTLVMDEIGLDNYEVVDFRERIIER